MEVSKESLYEDEDREQDRDRTNTSQIFRLIKDMANDKKRGPKRRTKRARRIGKGPGGERDMDVDDSDEEEDEELSMVDIRARVLAAGFTEAQLMETIINVSLPCHSCFIKCSHDLHSMRTSISGCAWPTTQNYASQTISARRLIVYSTFAVNYILLFACFVVCLSVFQRYFAVSI